MSFYKTLWFNRNIKAFYDGKKSAFYDQILPKPYPIEWQRSNNKLHTTATP
jgi:hypothetical protein